MKTANCVTSTRMPDITIADLSLDKWRPITPEKFVESLIDSSYYDSDFYIGPESVSLDLDNGANAVVWCTCVEVEHIDPTLEQSEQHVGIMTPEFLVLTSFPPGSDTRRYLCFVRT